MKRTGLDRMSTDDLWSLHVEVSELLQQRIQTEKQLLKRVPPDLNRRDSQRVRDERIFVH